MITYVGFCRKIYWYSLVEPPPPQLVAQALRFLSTTIRIGHYKEHFSDRRMISVLVEGVIVPNIGLRG